MRRVVWIDGKALVTLAAGRQHPTVIARGIVEHPALSYDGRFVAFIKAGRLRLAPADGGRSRVVAGDETFQWSPRANLIASVVGSQIIVVDAETGTERRLQGRGNVNDFAWSPDGRHIAVGYTGPVPIPAGFDIVTPDASEPTRAVAFAPAHDDNGFNQPLLLDGWQPNGESVLIWVQEMGSGSIMQDGLDLWLVPLDGSAPHDLGRTLVKREWVRWSGDGTRLAIVRSAGRMAIDGPRIVTVCATDGVCAPIAPDDRLTVDPAWSPDGRIAFVTEPVTQQPPLVRHNIPDWRAVYATRRLWIADADGSNAHEVSVAGGGVASPTWSADGARIVYVRDDALWTFDVREDRATRLVGPIKPVPVFEYGYQSNLAPPDAVYEPTAANRFSTWESLVTWR